MSLLLIFQILNEYSEYRPVKPCPLRLSMSFGKYIPFNHSFFCLFLSISQKAQSFRYMYYEHTSFARHLLFNMVQTASDGSQDCHNG